MSDVKIKFVNALPARLDASTIYLIKTGSNTLEIKVTDKEGRSAIQANTWNEVRPRIVQYQLGSLVTDPLFKFENNKLYFDTGIVGSDQWKAIADIGPKFVSEKYETFVKDLVNMRFTTESLGSYLTQHNEILPQFLTDMKNKFFAANINNNINLIDLLLDTPIVLQELQTVEHEIAKSNLLENSTYLARLVGVESGFGKKMAIILNSQSEALKACETFTEAFEDNYAITELLNSSVIWTMALTNKTILDKIDNLKPEELYRVINAWLKVEGLVPDCPSSVKTILDLTPNYSKAYNYSGLIKFLGSYEPYMTRILNRHKSVLDFTSGSRDGKFIIEYFKACGVPETLTQGTLTSLFGSYFLGYYGGYPANEAITKAISENKPIANTFVLNSKIIGDNLDPKSSSASYYVPVITGSPVLMNLFMERATDEQKQIFFNYTNSYSATGGNALFNTLNKSRSSGFLEILFDEKNRKWLDVVFPVDTSKGYHAASFGGHIDVDYLVDVLLQEKYQGAIPYVLRNSSMRTLLQTKEALLKKLFDVKNKEHWETYAALRFYQSQHSNDTIMNSLKDYILDLENEDLLFYMLKHYPEGEFYAKVASWVDKTRLTSFLTKPKYSDILKICVQNQSCLNAIKNMPGFYTLILSNIIPEVTEIALKSTVFLRSIPSVGSINYDTIFDEDKKNVFKQVIRNVDDLLNIVNNESRFVTRLDAENAKEAVKTALVPFTGSYPKDTLKVLKDINTDLWWRDEYIEEYKEIIKNTNNPNITHRTLASVNYFGTHDPISSKIAKIFFTIRTYELWDSGITSEPNVIKNLLDPDNYSEPLFRLFISKLAKERFKSSNGYGTLIPSIVTNDELAGMSPETIEKIRKQFLRSYYYLFVVASNFNKNTFKKLFIDTDKYLFALAPFFAVLPRSNYSSIFNYLQEFMVDPEVVGASKERLIDITCMFLRSNIGVLQGYSKSYFEPLLKEPKILKTFFLTENLWSARLNNTSFNSYNGGHVLPLEFLKDKIKTSGEGVYEVRGKPLDLINQGVFFPGKFVRVLCARNATSSDSIYQYLNFVGKRTSTGEEVPLSSLVTNQYVMEGSSSFIMHHTQNTSITSNLSNEGGYDVRLNNTKELSQKEIVIYMYVGPSEEEVKAHLNSIKTWYLNSAGVQTEGIFTWGLDTYNALDVETQAGLNYVNSGREFIYGENETNIQFKFIEKQDR